MLLLNKQEQDVFEKLSHGKDGEILRDYIKKVIDEVVNIDNLNSDIIVNMQNVKSILNSHLIDHLTLHEVESKEEDTYE